MRCLVLGASGFLGSHIVDKLVSEGHHVCGVCRNHEYIPSPCTSKISVNLTNENHSKFLFELGWDEVYQFAGDVGGSGYARALGNDYLTMTGNIAINMNVVKNHTSYGKVFFPSSAWVYPKSVECCSEDLAYPPNPASIYGWEKLIGEMLFGSIDNSVIARTHNVYGPRSPYEGAKALGPAALCYKAINTLDGGVIPLYGDGKQKRAFLYVTDYVDCVIKLMRSNCREVVNIGSDFSVSMLDVVNKIIDISGKNLKIALGGEPVDVARRSSDNTRLEMYVELGPTLSLAEGLRRTYEYVRKVCSA